MDFPQPKLKSFALNSISKETENSQVLFLDKISMKSVPVMNYALVAIENS